MNERDDPDYAIPRAAKATWARSVMSTLAQITTAIAAELGYMIERGTSVGVAEITTKGERPLMVVIAVGEDDVNNIKRKLKDICT
jgi:hypothetical protein